MKQIISLGRIFIGIAYLIYGYLHFSQIAVDANMVPSGIGPKTFWVIFIGICWWAVALSFFTNILTRLSGFLASVLLILVLFFVVLPDFESVSSWISIAPIFAGMGGSLLVAMQGNMWPIKKK